MTSATSALGTAERGKAEQQPAAGPSTRILYVTPEISDFVKAGGLGDVSAALPRALRARCDVRVLLPVIAKCFSVVARWGWSGRLDGLASIPPCDIAQIRMPDGLVAHVVLARSAASYQDIYARAIGGLRARRIA